MSASPSLGWQFSSSPPPQWDSWVRACGGSVFHTAAGLIVDAPLVAPLYGWLHDGDQKVIAIALGSRHGCRLARLERHIHFATLPAVVPDADSGSALDELKTSLRALGIAEATLGSFDATYLPPRDDRTPPRLEYVVPLSTPENFLAALKSTHRRHIRRGDHERWTVRALQGAEAESAILGVQESTAERAMSHARTFAPVQTTAWSSEIVSLEPFPSSGLAVFAAYREAELLSSVLVGWAGTRAFYLVGGSTPEGYRRSAAVWLHKQVIDRLMSTGIRTYNLGGTPYDAAQETSAGHGLYRFKTGFGVSPVERRGTHWELRRGHLLLHSMLARLRR